MRVLLAIALLAAAPSVRAAPRVELPPLKIGDRVRYAVESQGTASALPDTRVVVDLEVVSKTVTGHILSWTWRRMDFVGRSPEVVAEMQPLADLCKDLTLVVAVDGRGDFVRVVNEKEVAQAVERAIQEEVRSARAVTEEPPGYKPVRLRWVVSNLSWLTKPDKVHRLIGTELGAVLGLAGLVVALSAPSSYEEIRPSPFGGLPMRGQAELLEVRGHEAKLRVHESVDREMHSAVRAEVERAQRDWAVRSPVPVVALETEAAYVVDMRDGWPTSVELTQTQSGEVPERKTTWRLKRVTAIGPSTRKR